MSRSNIIKVNNLTKIFKNQVRAVDGISLSVKEGTILGFLGPNGAGKTTTLNMLSTLLKPTSGTATVNGYDIIENPDSVRRSIGYVFQDPTLDIELTGRENLDFHCRIYGLDQETRQQRINEMMELVQLTDRADDLVKTYSGGMKRRLEIARGLLHHPKVLFLDEPTLGLDPQTRHSIWEHIQRLNQQEKVTIVLTTHYTEEADFLCDCILIIDFGKIVALDTPEKLKQNLKGDVVSLTFKDPAMIPKVLTLFEGKKWVHRVQTVSSSSNNRAIAAKMMNRMDDMRMSSRIMGRENPEEPGISRHTQKELSQEYTGFSSASRRLNLLVDDGGHRIPTIVKLVDEAGLDLESVELHKPTLDDVFISVTGRNIRDEQGSFMEMIRRHRTIQQARGRRVPG